MKKRVEHSSYCLIISTLSSAVLCRVLVYSFRQPDGDMWGWLLAGAVVLLFIGMLFFMPLSITLDESSININRPLKTKKIPLSEVADVKMCPPTMGAIRVCGSGGWFGWYGWFREKDLGKYFAYYGKASDCFLVTLKDGRKYMLGCKDAPEMSDAIQHKLNCR